MHDKISYFRQSYNKFARYIQFVYLIWIWNQSNYHTFRKKYIFRHIDRALTEHSYEKSRTETQNDTQKFLVTTYTFIFNFKILNFGNQSGILYYNKFIFNNRNGSFSPTARRKNACIGTKYGLKAHSLSYFKAVQLFKMLQQLFKMPSAYALLLLGGIFPPWPPTVTTRKQQIVAETRAQARHPCWLRMLNYGCTKCVFVSALSTLWCTGETRFIL